jgi:hypothetical protein
MDDTNRVVSLLEELVAWTRFAHQESLVRALDMVLLDDRHLRAYELTDGSRTQSEVAAESALSQPSISGLWQKWRRLGLAREQAGRTLHLVNPSDIGMERALRLRSRQLSSASIIAEDELASRE